MKLNRYKIMHTVNPLISAVAGTYLKIFQFNMALIRGRYLSQNLLKEYASETNFLYSTFLNKNSSLPYISMNYKVAQVFLIMKFGQFLISAAITFIVRLSLGKGTEYPSDYYRFLTK